MKEGRLTLRRVVILINVLLALGLFALVGGVWLYTALAGPISVSFPTPTGEDPTADHSFVHVEAGRLKLRRQHAYASRVGAGTGVQSVGVIDATQRNALFVRDVVKADDGTTPAASEPTAPTDIHVSIAQAPGAGTFPWKWESGGIAPQVGLNGATFVMRVNTWAFPLWWLMILALLITAPALWLGRRSHRWRLAGLCPACGYDLRETPDRCPECGRPAAPRIDPV